MSFFDSIGHGIKNFFKHPTSIAAEAVGTMFGIPPGHAGAVAELLRKHHHGDRHASAQLQTLAARNPREREFINHVHTHVIRPYYRR